MLYEYDPTPQSAGVEAPAKQKYPRGHMTHDALLFAPIKLLNFPVGHNVHTEALSIELYVPTGQSIFDIPLQNEPAAQPKHVVVLNETFPYIPFAQA
jgi:hypothetical protein